MPKSELSMHFTRVAVLADDHVVLGGHLYSQDEDDRVTRLVELDHGDWRHLADLPEIVSVLRATQQDEDTTCSALLRNGVTHHWRGKQHSVEVIDSQRGLFFNDLNQIDGSLYACGTGRQVFRKQGQRWLAIDDGMFVGPVRPLRLLRGIDGFSSTDIFASGTIGEIWHYNGHRWQSLESPTNIDFTRMLCTGNVTYHCGARGLVCRGGVEGWELLEGANPEAMLTDITTYKGQVYLCSEFELLRVSGNELVPVPTHLEEELAFGSLAANERQLWSVGGETILRFDGVKWEKFEFPWN